MQHVEIPFSKKSLRKNFVNGFELGFKLGYDHLRATRTTQKLI